MADVANMELLPGGGSGLSAIGGRSWGIPDGDRLRLAWNGWTTSC